ncbi:KAT8 regulatory NSL complex subunit 1-like isoform X2 [Anneissia japonica]|nr:KAT8 regulatory NSL complex subunit 1-like isoform X2 [Anneissia japonica]
MAPALTDAAAHPRSCKLPASPMNPENNNSLRANPGSPSDPAIGLGSGGNILSRTLELDTASQIIKGATTLETFHHVVNGNGKQKHIVSDKRLKLNGKNGGSKLILSNGNSHHHTILEKISIDLTPLSKTSINSTSSMTGTSMLKKIDLPTNLNGHSNGNSATMPPETTTTLTRLRDTKKEDDLGELERDISTNTRISDIDVENIDSEMPENAHVEDSSHIPNITGELEDPIEKQCDASKEKEMKVNAKRTDSLKRQKKLEHQAIVLRKRIRRIQSRQISSHVKKQIGDAVDHEYKLCELLKDPIEDEVSSERLVEDKTLEVSPKDTKVNSGFLPGGGSESSGRTGCEGSPHITEEFLKAKTSDMQVVIGNLNANLQHLENSMDSDATESSSGGETDDEDDASKSSLKLHKVPLHKRSIWRWAKARSAIASRWTWLQAQVSDLEYRIRQQNDIHRQIRSTKGAVTLGEPPSAEEILRIKTVNNSYRPGKKLSPIEAKIAKLEGKNELSPSNISMLLCNVDRQSAKLQKSFQNCVSPTSGSPNSHHHATNGGDKVHPSRTTINGVVDGTKTNIGTPSNQHKRIRIETNTPSPSSFSLQIPNEDKYCARTRPVKYYRKRRIVKSIGIHYLSRKAAKRSTVKCRCCQPQMPCVMCGGRYNNLKPLDTNFTPEKERLSLLDYSYHPVLSFKKDVPATIRLENLLSNGDWHRRSSSKAQSRKKSRLSSRDKKAKRKLSKNSSYLFASKLRDLRQHKKEKEKMLACSLPNFPTKELRELKQLKKESKMLSRSHSQPVTPKGSLDLSRQCRMDIKKKRAAQLAIAALKKRARSLSLPDINCKTPSGASTPTLEGQGFNTLLTSVPPHTLNSMRRKCASSDAYDIDNIVIPYSILSSTRVEKLNYKEIVTPKWRMVTDEEVLKRNLLLQESAEDQPDEDDQQNIEAIKLRHSKSEVMEKSLYMVALTDHSHSNMRRSHSRRSRTNSATTPDPNSPDLIMSETQMSDNLNASSSAISLPASASVTPSQSPVTVQDSSVLERNPEKRRISNNSESAVQFEEEFPMVDPWPLRTFPLTEEETKDLEADTSIFHLEPDFYKSSGTSTPKSSVTLSRAQSPRSDLSSEPEDLNEDPNDPEWTIVMKQKKVEVTPKGSIVLKLARR